jgi:dolichol-phosphate mannosyltransferase
MWHLRAVLPLARGACVPQDCDPYTDGGTPLPGPPHQHPLVSVVIPALNEAGKIGRALDKFPRDARFEAIVVDDGSSDGTGDEARVHGAAVVIRHDIRQGVGAAIRDGFRAGLERGSLYLGLISGDDQHEPAELVPAFDALLAANADYAQGSRWMPGGRVVGPDGGRRLGTRVYSAVFSLLVRRRISDATNGFRIFKADILRDAAINLDQEWLTSYDLEPYVLYKSIRRGYRVIEVPCTVRYHATERHSHMRGLRDWWRLLRPALLLSTRVRR